jgi:hypothetical protein
MSSEAAAHDQDTGMTAVGQSVIASPQLLPILKGNGDSQTTTVEGEIDRALMV